MKNLESAFYVKQTSRQWNIGVKSADTTLLMSHDLQAKHPILNTKKGLRNVHT